MGQFRKWLHAGGSAVFDTAVLSGGALSAPDVSYSDLTGTRRIFSRSVLRISGVTRCHHGP